MELFRLKTQKLFLATSRSYQFCLLCAGHALHSVLQDKRFPQSRNFDVVHQMNWSASPGIARARSIVVGLHSLVEVRSLPGIVSAVTATEDIDVV